MKPIVRYIICYDISSNKVRNKVEKILKDAGLTRMQYSVFEGRLPSDRINYLSEKFRKLEKKQTHSIIVHVISGNGNLEKIMF